MKVEDGVCRSVRVGMTGVNPAPMLVRDIPRLLEAQPYSPERVDEAAQAVIRTGKPLKTSVSTPEYRRDILRVFARRALTRLWNGKN
jgi:CO/xanthine dehydrogenase FAD-binding subunit